MVKSDIGKLVNECCDRYSTAEVEPILDAIKATGFHYATRAGLTVSVWDAVIPPEKQSMLDEAQAKVDDHQRELRGWLPHEQERHVEVVNAWTECTEALGSRCFRASVRTTRST
jgi:DNA-directed RNA polymerase subunit beta'